MKLELFNTEHIDLFTNLCGRWDINMYIKGQRTVGIDWHKFKIKSGQPGVPGRMVNRPHIEIGSKYPRQKVRHWPW